MSYESWRISYQSSEQAARAAYAEIEKLRAEVEALRALCAAAYQMAGVHDASVEWLDALSNAASGRPFSTDGLLPYMPQAVCNAEVRALELEREVERVTCELMDAITRADKLRKEVERLKSMTAVTMGVGSGGGNLFVHGDYESIKAAQDIVLERDKLRREVEGWKSVAEAQAALHDEVEDHAEDLAKSLAELITWIPSADTYRRLGFDPEAPMRALKRAKLSLGGVSSA